MGRTDPWCNRIRLLADASWCTMAVIGNLLPPTSILFVSVFQSATGVVRSAF